MGATSLKPRPNITNSSRYMANETAHVMLSFVKMRYIYHLSPLYNQVFHTRQPEVISANN